MRTVLIAIEMLAASIWVGSLVCLAVVANAARDALDPASRIALFRGVGRRYGIVGSGALIVAIAVGAALAGRPSHWTAAVWAALMLSIALVVVAALGMAQARRMTVRRRQAVGVPGNDAVHRVVRSGAAVAAALRASIAVLTLVILVLGAHAINH